MTSLFLLTVWLLTRLCFIRYDQRLPTRLLLILVLIPIILAPALALGVTSMLWSILVAAALVFSEKVIPEKLLVPGRLMGLAFVVVATWLMPLPELSSWSVLTIDWLGLTTEQLTTGLWWLLGFLLVAGEANLLIRVLFHSFDLEPMSKTPEPAETAEAETEQTTTANQNAEPEIDQREYNAGRIIGILERWLMYIVLVGSQQQGAVSGSQYSIIAVILAAKGFARFRQLEERAFAEYVLIGTLASTLLTVAVSLLISHHILS
ncbi:MAG: hypothetical protein ABJ000_16650 [Saccharospirillum sp.]|uniref:hypothetical protein n=1 Tax=Saccharospirillum sp. TaxID=2033801 RepID=UPI00329680CF